MSNDNYGDQPTSGATHLQKRLGKYELVRPLGRGGMGEVWLAVDTIADVQVALKMLPPELRYSEEAQEQIRQSYRRIHGLHHPAICSVKDLVLEPGVGFFLVMDYFDGVTLSKYRSDCVDRHGRFPLEEVVRVLTPVAQALDHAHQSGIVHRDIKPTNILVKRDGKEARIIDFQLAADIRTSLTRFTKLAVDTSGTFPYMAPEQFLGQRANPRTDIYALAMVAYELLVGDLPFEAISFEQWKSIITDNRTQFVSYSELPAQALTAILQGLSRDPVARPAKSTDFVRSLTVVEMPIREQVSASKASSSNDGSSKSAQPTETREQTIDTSSSKASLSLAEKVAGDKFFVALTTYLRMLRYRDWLPRFAIGAMISCSLLFTALNAGVTVVVYAVVDKSLRDFTYGEFLSASKTSLSSDERLLLRKDQLESPVEFGYSSSATLSLIDANGVYGCGRNEPHDPDCLFEFQELGLQQEFPLLRLEKTSYSCSLDFERSVTSNNPSERDGYTQLQNANKRLEELGVAREHLLLLIGEYRKQCIQSAEFWAPLWGCIIFLGGMTATVFGGMKYGWPQVRDRVQRRAAALKDCRAALLSQFPEQLRSCLGLRPLDDDELVYRAACEVATAERLQNLGLHRYRYLAAFLAFPFGVLGLHKFLTGRHFAGLIHVLISCTFFGLFAQIPVILAECVIYLRTDTAYFYKHYWIGRREWF